VPARRGTGEALRGSDGRSLGAPRSHRRYYRDTLRCLACSGSPRFALATCLVGGLDGFIAWIKERPEHRFAFYTRIYPRLLPVNLDIRSHKDVVYHTVQDIQDRFGQVGMTLELIERLRRDEANQPKIIEHVRVD
jgi:hypothetical protein